jgi:endonuclease YncB( thermonuclease family)
LADHNDTLPSMVRLPTKLWIARGAQSTVLLLIAVFSALLAGPGCHEDKGTPANYRPTHQYARYLDIRRVEFDDGDTFLLDGAPIRILGIDTPETKSPSVGIYEDQPFGLEAAESTKALMTRARLLEWVPDGKDYYGRQLAHVLVDGDLLGVKLIEIGLAYENVSYFGDNGFPDLADLILQSSLNAPRPAFEPPHRWRRKHQKRP